MGGRGPLVICRFECQDTSTFLWALHLGRNLVNMFSSTTKVRYSLIYRDSSIWNWYWCCSSVTLKIVQKWILELARAIPCICLELMSLSTLHQHDLKIRFPQAFNLVLILIAHDLLWLSKNIADIPRSYLQLCQLRTVQRIFTEHCLRGNNRSMQQ